MTENNLLDQNSNQDIDHFAEFTKPGGKFYDPDPEVAKRKIGKAKYDSDLYIRTLEQQKDELRADNLKYREQVVTKANLEELIDQLEAKQKLSAQTLNAPDASIQKPQFDPKDIEGLVTKSIQAHEMTKTQEQNFNLVKSKLRERFGENYQTILKQHIDNLGLTEDYVNDMARKFPNALLKTLSVDAPAGNKTFQAPPRSDMRIDNFSPQVQKRTWSYYQNLKKQDYKAYQDPKTQVQMHHDAVALGEEFKDGDYDAL